jgi:phosphoribosylformimino-5-aminoimidazole carboxamide ribotide isomerase
MLVIPAIDIQDACVVRLVQGKSDKKTYSRDPVKTARHWVKQGAELIHLVDLDGAFRGKPKNVEIAKEIVKNVSIPVEFGGGVRDMAMIKRLLDLGIYRVVLGTRAIQDRAFLKKAYKIFKYRVIVSLDARDDKVVVSGWKASAGNKNLIRLAGNLKEVGFREFIYTDTLKDGTLKGPNIKSIKALLKKSKMRIIASGGVSCLDDIYRLKLLEKLGLSGIIVGKALYEGKFTLSQSLKIS